MDTRKRGRPEAKANGGAKRSKSESQLGSKSKPCMKFFSMDGCPFGEKCHFLHFFPGGYNAVAQVMNLPPASTVRTPSAPSTIQDGSSAPATKSKLCNKYNTAEGCKFGDKCHFAHGAWELGKPINVSSQEPIPSRPFGNHMEPPPPPPPAAGVAASFGATATAKISVDASLAGAIIGKGGVNSKQICRETGVKLSIRDHESDGNLRNIELEGTFDQIKEASSMVRELIVSMSLTATATGAGAGAGAGVGVRPAAPSGPLMSNNYKTKLCENFAKGCCTFGERCHFAHGNGELRKSGVI